MRPLRSPRIVRRQSVAIAISVFTVVTVLISVAGCTGTATTDVSAGGPNGSSPIAGSTGSTIRVPTSVMAPPTTVAGPSTAPLTPLTSSPLTSSTPPTSTDLTRTLNGRAFESTSVRAKGAERPLAAGTKLTLGFRDAQLSASGGCNSMGGAFRLEGDILTVEGLISTEMACSPPERMTQEEWLAGALSASPRIRLEGSQLTLDAPDVTIVFVDRMVTEPDRPLIATHWVADTVVDGPSASNVPAGADSPSLDFAADGTFRGFSGCAPLTGRYTVEGARLRLDDVIVANASACTVEGERLNGATNALLIGTITFEIDGPSLRLTNGEKGLHLRAG